MRETGQETGGRHTCTVAHARAVCPGQSSSAAAGAVGRGWESLVRPVGATKTLVVSLCGICFCT